MINIQNKNEHMTIENKEERATEIYRIITAVLLIVIILLLSLLNKNCHCCCSEIDGIPWDSNVTYDEYQHQSDVDALNQKAADGMITVSMNADPVFENGTAKGNLQILNDVSNTRPQVVEIYLKNTEGKVNKDKLVYRSGKIPVGGKIQSVALDQKLSKGDYAALAVFNAISDNDEIIGTVGADITLHILN